MVLDVARGNGLDQQVPNCGCLNGPRNDLPATGISGKLIQHLTLTAATDDV